LTVTDAVCDAGFGMADQVEDHVIYGGVKLSVVAMQFEDTLCPELPPSPIIV
jgi:hypothetical protein